MAEADVIANEKCQNTRIKTYEIMVRGVFLVFAGIVVFAALGVDARVLVARTLERAGVDSEAGKDGAGDDSREESSLVYSS